MKDDIENLKDFVRKVQYNVNDFFSNIDGKLKGLSGSFQAQLEEKMEDRR